MLRKIMNFDPYSFLALIIFIFNIIGCSNSPTEPDSLPDQETSIQIISAGSFHNLAWQSNREILAWGRNSFGQLGRGYSQRSNIPVSTRKISGIQSIYCGVNHTLVLKTDGTVWAWGSNTSFQLATKDLAAERSDTPLHINKLNNDVIEIACGTSHNLALKSDGTVWSWGFSNLGRLGLNLPEQSVSVAIPTLISGLPEIKAIRASTLGHNFALATDGSIWAWGMNEKGQLGIGTNENARAPVLLPALNDVKDIQAGDYHTIFLMNDGTVWASGDNTFGQLGNRYVLVSNSPTKIVGLGLNNALQIICGGYYSFAIMRDMTVWAWGANSFGQFGNGTTIGSYEPTPLEDINDFALISAGHSHNLMLKTDGSVWAWGYNANGQLGIGNTVNVYFPTIVEF